MFQLTSTPKTNEKPSTWYLPIGEFILGRGAKPHINLGNDLSISRQHATIRITPGKFQPTSKKSRFKIEIHDGVFKKATNTWKRSATGTLVNEVALGDEWKELKTSTTLKFASLIVSVFVRKGEQQLGQRYPWLFPSPSSPVLPPAPPPASPSNPHRFVFFLSPHCFKRRNVFSTLYRRAIGKSSPLKLWGTKKVGCKNCPLKLGFTW
jgi:hypothetical protein